jgi:hypothetical protein
MHQGKRALLNHCAGRHAITHHFNNENASFAIKVLNRKFVGELDVCCVRVLTYLFNTGFKSIKVDVSVELFEVFLVVSLCVEFKNTHVQLLDVL